MNLPPHAAQPGVHPAQSPTADNAAGVGAAHHRSLLDLFSDGIYLLMMLKRGQLPSDEGRFVQSIQTLLEKVERGAHKLGIAAEDVYSAKYAFCAAVDEAILSQPGAALREAWERNPLQLRLFGENLAGEHFFDRLDQLRAQGAPRLPSLEVYHYCLLLGLEGKYRIEGPEKLGYLSARLGDEITFLKGRKVGFAPHWMPPDRVTHALRRIVPLWAPAALLGGLGLIAFLGVSAMLSRQTDRDLAKYQDVVQMPPQTARVTISLP